MNASGMLATGLTNRLIDFCLSCVHDLLYDIQILCKHEADPGAADEPNTLLSLSRQ